jgi:hypothetical protein
LENNFKMIENLIDKKDSLVETIIDSIEHLRVKSFEPILKVIFEELTHNICRSVEGILNVPGIINYQPYSNYFSVPNFISAVAPNIYFRSVCENYGGEFHKRGIFRLFINFGVSHYFSGNLPILPHHYYFKKFESGSVSEGRKNYKRLVLPSGAPFWQMYNIEDDYTGDLPFTDVLLREFAKLETHGEAMFFTARARQRFL